MSRPRGLSNEVPALTVVSPLVLQPLTITLHASNLFPVVIRNRVRDRVGRRVYAEAANTIEELFLFLHPTLALGRFIVLSGYLPSSRME